MKNRIPWSITTTVRNPERLKMFLACLAQYEGRFWNDETQIDYQISLIQKRFYGYGRKQFYIASGNTQELNDDQKELIDDLSRQISFEQAKEIFETKGYEDPAMRGRNSFNPLKKFGLVEIKDKKIRITEFGKEFLKDDSDMGDLLLISLLKWQIPNPLTSDYKEADFYNIKPFIGVMHLIDLVNKKEEARGKKEKGISKKEFCLFAPILVHYRKIDFYAEQVIELRDSLEDKNEDEKKSVFEKFQEKFILKFLDGNQKKYKKTVKNLKDYGDNAIRYFRLTGYFHIRGNGFYIDLERRRKIEIEALLDKDNARALDFDTKNEYYEYLSNPDSYVLPWKERQSYLEIVKLITKDIRGVEAELNLPQKQLKDVASLNMEDFENHISMLRAYRKKLQNDLTYKELQDIENIKKNNALLKEIYSLKKRPILLEKLAALGLYALNDAKQIKPNYPTGDDNEPTFTAPANVPDIECFYEEFNAICEVTMLSSRDQWYNEGQPVMRHLRDFEDKHSDKECYCLFIAPKIHRDTLNTFWISIKHDFEGKKQKIIPLSIEEFTDILDFLVAVKQNGKPFKQGDIYELYESIIKKSHSESKSTDWLAKIPETIEAWKGAFDL